MVFSSKNIEIKVEPYHAFYSVLYLKFLFMDLKYNFFLFIWSDPDNA